MKKIATITTIFFAFGWLSFASIANTQSVGIAPKLPYEKGETFLVTQGFHAPPTHVKKDDFAIDFTQNGCDAYAKPAVASVSGKAWVVQNVGYNGGYGTQLLMRGDGNVVTRYAHLIPDSVSVNVGDDIPQGTRVGEIGNSGLVAGTACKVHPGTHIHFAMDTENADGSFAAKDPEPISGYADIESGQWYLSDNALPADVSEKTDLPAVIGEAAGIAAQGGIQASQDVVRNGGTSQTNNADKQMLALPGRAATSVVEQSQTPSSSGSATGGAGDQSGMGVSEIASLNFPQGTSSSSVAGEQAIPASGGGFGPAGTSASPPVGGIVASPTSSTESGNSGVNASGAIPDGSSSTTGIFPSAAASSSQSSASTAEDAGGGSVTSSQPIATTPPTIPVTAGSSSDAVATSSLPFFLDAPAPISDADSLASFNSSSLAIDLAWQPPKNASGSGSLTYDIFIANRNSSGSTFIASTTSDSFSYAIPDADFGGDYSFAVQATDGSGDQSFFATAIVAVPNWLSAVQPVASDDSRPSWYSDNWYDLGTGFRGTIRSLTLEGFVNSDFFGASEVTLQEFSDPAYTVLDHTFPISPAPFAQTIAKLTVSDLKIPLSPEKYYRLTTVQQFQNRSVVLKGTDSTGTAMFDEFAPGIGGIQHTYDFYPYLSAIIEPQKLVIAPPRLSGNISISFDSANSKIGVSGPAATDTDEPLTPPSYQVNIGTSGTLDPAQWQSEGGKLSASFNVTFPNAYVIGVRALDDFENPSAPITASWNFPEDYVPIPSQFDHAVTLGDQGGAEELTFLATTTASAIDFWTAPVRGIYCCSQTYLSIYENNGGVPGTEIPSGNPTITFGPFDGGAEVSYPFSAPITFSPGNYWFAIAIGPSRTTNPTTIYGSGNDAYPGGSWSTSPSQDAYFRIVRTNGP